jgi:hypothetical protein
MPPKGDEADDTLNQYITSPAIQFFRYRLLAILAHAHTLLQAHDTAELCI